MNCADLDQLLAEGKPLPAEAGEHLSTCPGCRALAGGLNPSGDRPSAQKLEYIEGLIAGSLKPVRPLPSNKILAGSLVLLFVVFALLTAAPVHYFALRALQLHQEVPYFGALVLLAVLFSVAIVERIIPGSKRQISGWMLILLTFCGLGALCAVLFGWSHFARGWMCLRFGSLCMLAGGLLAALFVRNGFVTSPLETSTIVGLFAGIAGFAALALHCPVLSATHILVWHLGPVALGGTAGALIGLLLQAGMRSSSTS